MSTVLERLLKYVVVDTESKHDVADRFPSTEKQKDLGRMLVDEMKEMGMEKVSMDENGYVFGTIPANNGGNCPVVGFIAHMDTSPDFCGKGVKPRVIKNYDGSDIVLNEEKGIVTAVDYFPVLKKYIGEDLVVTDGTTLLGADDKAGIAEILTMAENLLKNPAIKHGDIKIGFTPDEEVGKGASRFDVDRFGADFAYTVDGGLIGEMIYETFNAADARIYIHGKNIHPGQAKDKMINAITVAFEFDGMLPQAQRPVHTEGYEGFNHVTDFNGTVELAYMKYIIRDHDKYRFEKKEERFNEIAAYLNNKYGAGTVEVKLEYSYKNMKEQLMPVFYVVEVVENVLKEMGITPYTTPLRGGTDGATLTRMGLPCPNICRGGNCGHGKHEFISVQSMEAAVKILTGVSKAAGNLKI